jgi:hypothetical protein
MESICCRCKVSKSYDEFCKDKHAPLGIARACRACKSEQGRAYRQREGVKEAASARAKKHYQNNKEKVAARHRKWAEDNSGRMKELQRNWNERNREHTAAKMRNKRRTDDLFHLKSVVSNSVYRAIRQRLNASKDDDTWIALSYTPQQLKEHLESQFEDWMTWDNYGLWHIDHIYPHSKFQYETLEDEAFKLCWSLENLRPLEATENIRKGNSVLVEFEDVFGCEKPEKVA